MNNKKISPLLKMMILSRLISTFGSALSNMVISVLLLQVTGSAWWLSSAILCRLLSGFLFSPLIGFFVDRTNRRHLMMISDIVLGFFVILLLFVNKVYLPYYILFLMFLMGIFSSISEISMNSTIPSLSAKENSKLLNGIFFCGQNVVVAIAGVLAAFVLQLNNHYHIVFIFDALTFFVSAIGLVFIPLDNFKVSHLEEKGTPIKNENKFRTLISDYLSLANISEMKIIKLFLILLFLDTFASASHNVGFPLFSQALNPKSPLKIFGLINTFWGIGNILGFIILKTSTRLNTLRPELLYVFFTGVMSLGMTLIFQTQIEIIIVAAALVAGIGDGIYQTFFSLYVQKLASNVRGKIFALTNSILKAGFLCGFLFFPIVLKVLPVNLAVMSFHGPLILITTILFWHLSVSAPEIKGESTIKPF